MTWLRVLGVFAVLAVIGVATAADEQPAEANPQLVVSGLLELDLVDQLTLASDWHDLLTDQFDQGELASRLRGLPTLTAILLPGQRFALLMARDPAGVLWSLPPLRLQRAPNDAPALREAIIEAVNRYLRELLDSGEPVEAI